MMGTDYVALADRLEAERDREREVATLAERENRRLWNKLGDTQVERDELAVMLRRVLDRAATDELYDEIGVQIRHEARVLLARIDTKKEDG